MTPQQCKNNSRYSGKFKGFSPLKLSYNMTGKCYAVGYYSYTQGYKQTGRKNVIRIG